MTYTKAYFDSTTTPSQDAPKLFPADEAEAKRYVFNAVKSDPGNESKCDVELGVNVALSAGRPLLVLGGSGQGKSTLAAAVAWRMGWRFLRTIVTARTTAEDLLWQVDTVQRLADAQTKTLKPDLRYYLSPGPLWWALHPAKARLHGFLDPKKLEKGKVRPAQPPGSPDAGERFDGRRAVLLIDEIDKADPDVPNALLGPLGNWRFAVRPIEDEVTLADEKNPPLVVLTSNDERALPAAFVRRCIVVRLEEANKDALVAIAKAHFEDANEALLQRIAASAVAERDSEGKILVSPAEVLNAVKACRDLGIKEGARFNELVRYALSKQSARG